jgi:branched-chain amino acid transport system substrate-binding protein
VRIGVAYPSPNAPTAFLAADEINATGGIRGRRLQLVVDTITSSFEPTDLEIQRAQRLVGQAVVAVAGHGGSRGSLAAAPVYNAARIVQLVPIGTSRLLRESGPWTLRMAPDDSIEGAFLARFACDSLSARNVVLFHMSDEYGFGIRRGVEAALAERGVRVRRSQRFDIQSDLSTLVDGAVRGEPVDVAVIAGRTFETADIVRRLAVVSPRTRVVAAEGASILPGLPQLVGQAGQGMYVAAFWLPDAPDSASRRFAASVQQRLGRLATAGDAMLYDAVRLLAGAAAAAGPSPAEMRDWINSLGVNRPAFRGVTGALSVGKPAGVRFVMGQVRGDRIVSLGGMP